MKIGVLMPIDGHQQGSVPSYREIRDLAIATEGAGFDSIWVNDHLLYRFPERPTLGIREAWTVLAGLAEATSRVELGTIVLCLPFRSPGVLAKMADTLDEMSGGRVILGIGAGWHQPEFDAFGIPFDHLVSRFEDGVRIISSLLRTGQATVRGTYYSADDAVLLPAGPRTGKGPGRSIPIMIAGTKPRISRLTAEYADIWNAAWLGRSTLLAERRRELDRALADLGKDASAVETTVGVSIRFPDLERAFYGANAPSGDIDPDRVLTGTPAEMAEVFREYEQLGVSHLQLMHLPPTMAGLERLAEALRIYRGA